MKTTTKQKLIWPFLILTMIILFTACDHNSSNVIGDTSSSNISLPINDASDKMEHPPIQTVCDIKFDASDWENYATITAYDQDGAVVWEYKTLEYEETELARVSEIGRKDEMYYFIEDRAVIALDAQTGALVWKNDDFGGSGTGIALGEDAIYICGQYGPDFYAISYDGKTLSKIQEFDEEYCWASEIEILGDRAAVYMRGGTIDYDTPQIFYVDLRTYDVTTNLPSKAAGRPESRSYTSYQEILDILYQGISNHWADYDYYHSDFSGDLGISYMWYMDPNISLDNSGYALIDLNDDGTSELLVSKVAEGAWGSGEGMIYDLYSLQNGKVVHLASSGERDTYHLCKNNMIANESSNSASNMVHRFYSMNRDGTGLKLKEFVVYDDLKKPKDPWFYGTVATSIPNDLGPIESGRAWEIIDSYEAISIELIMFDLYTPGKL